MSAAQQSPSGKDDSSGDQMDYMDETHEGRPQLLYTKFQRLKNSTKLARVLIVDEMPEIKLTPNDKMTAATTRATENAQNRTFNQSATAKMGGSEQMSEDGDLASTKHGVQSSHMSGWNRTRVFDRSQSPKTLLYYPEEMHTPKEDDCHLFNARIMKHLMKQKMFKNQTFYQLKV